MISTQSSPLIVEKIESVEQLRALEPEWRELERASGNCLPFQTADWVISWWTHLSENRSAVRDSLFVRAMRMQSGELMAVAPLMRTERPAVGPVRIRILQFFGPDGYVTERSGLLCLPGVEGKAHEALLDHLRASAFEWDWMVWSALEVAGASEKSVELAGAIEWGAKTPGYVLPLAATWEEFRASLPRNVKESLRKCYNSLKRDGCSHSFEVVDRREDFGPALDHFFRLHSARAARAGTTPHKDFFKSAKARRFLLDACQRLADRRMARLFILRIDGEVVAARLGFIVGPSLYLYFSGYDPAFGKYSVMTTVVAEAMRYAIAQGLRSVNLSMGKDVSKTRWRPTETLYRDALQVSPSRRAGLSLRLYRSIRSGLSGSPLRGIAARFLWRRAG